MQGKRGYTTEFMCDLSQINSVEKVNNTKSLKKGAARYIYFRNMRPDNIYALSVTIDNNNYEVFLEINNDGKAFLDMISK